MRFLTISVLLVSVSLVSCARRFDNVKEHNKRKGKLNQLQVVRNEVNVDVFQKVSVNYFVGNKRRNIQPICRGIDGCLRVCEYFKYAKCKQLSADKVASFWLNKIGEYNSWEHARNDLNLIATNPDVSSFLKNVDKDNHVVRSLLRLNTSADCPMDNTQNIYFSYSPSASLYLTSSPPASEEESAEDAATEDADAEAAVEAVATEDAEAEAAVEAVATEDADAEAAVEAVATEDADAEAEAAVEAVATEDADATEDAAEDAVVEADTAPAEEEVVVSNSPSVRKKIVDGSVIPFDLQVFAGFVKSCFGYNTRTFSEMAVQIENQDAFDIAHTVLSKSCGENSECIRLAYCAIDSDLVWGKLQESVKQPGCEFDNFVEMLP